jgi:hypothetical protein
MIGASCVILGYVAAAMLYVTLEPILRRTALTLLATLFLAGANIIATWRWGGDSRQWACALPSR